jgi:hypothetical protein
MPNTVKAQQGMTAISMLMIAFLVGFVAMIAIKLAPTYFAHFKVQAALKNLPTDSRAEGAPDKAIKELILKKLDVDDVDFVKAEDIAITKTASGRTVAIDYEARVPMFGNVDAVVKFDKNSVELTK